MGEKSRAARVPQPKPPAIFLCSVDPPKASCGLSQISRRKYLSVEFLGRRGLSRAYPARNNIGAGIILRAHGRSGQATQHRDLTEMRERVREGSLEDPLRCKAER